MAVRQRHRPRLWRRRTGIFGACIVFSCVLASVRSACSLLTATGKLNAMFLMRFSSRPYAACSFLFKEIFTVPLSMPFTVPSVLLSRAMDFLFLFLIILVQCSFFMILPHIAFSVLPPSATVPVCQNHK